MFYILVSGSYNIITSNRGLKRMIFYFPFLHQLFGVEKLNLFDVSGGSNQHNN